MLAATEGTVMAKKKSETRKHPALIRVSDEALEATKLAASLMKISLADYASAILLKTADRDIKREVRKLTGESD